MSASLQMAVCWHRISMATDSFGSKALLFMEIAALAARSLKCWMRNLENGRGLIIVSAGISAPKLTQSPEDHEKRPEAGPLVTMILGTAGEGRAVRDPRSLT
jgi:hypothetical protein